MRHYSAPGAAAVLLGGLLVLSSPAATPRALADQSALRTGVVLLTIDVQVTPSKNARLRELTFADFEVTVSGRNRPVASAAFLHLDEASVAPNQPRPGQVSSSDCVFGFRRKLDRPTAHYRLAVEPVDTDRGAKELKVKTVDPAFAAQWLVWRLPIR
jgi:hypothetical protein